VADGALREEMHTLLLALVAQFKILGVTSLLTFEASSMYATGAVTDGGLSPVADNIVLLRYVRAGGEDRPSLAVVKMRGSAHTRATHFFSLSKGGMQMGERVGAAPGTGSSRPDGRNG
jgi:circadian clock protein KaiC